MSVHGLDATVAGFWHGSQRGPRGCFLYSLILTMASKVYVWATIRSALT